MRILVVGLGAFSSSLCETLSGLGHEVIAIERDGERADRCAALCTRVIAGDATDPQVLERAGARDVDAAAIGTGENLATTILTSMALRDLGVRYIYAKVASLTEARALDRIGVSGTAFPEREAGERLAHAIVSRNVLNYTALAPGYSMQEVAVPAAWIGRSLLELETRARLRVQAIAVRDVLTGQLSLPPDPSRKLRTSDSLLLAGPDATLSKLDRDGGS